MDYVSFITMKKILSRSLVFKTNISENFRHKPFRSDRATLLGKPAVPHDTDLTTFSQP